MMKHFSFIAVCLGLFGAGIGCRSSITVFDLQPKARTQPKLPRLMPVMDVYAASALPVLVGYTGIADTFAGRQPALLPPVLDSMEHRRIRTTYLQDANANEMLVFFARDVERNLSRSQGPAKGYISCRINAMETPLTGLGYRYLHGMTLGALLLVGVPSMVARCNMEIEVVVRDRNYQPLKRYWGVSDVRKYSGAYYGYRWADIQRATNLAAFKAALEQVNLQITADHTFLEENL